MIKIIMIITLFSFLQLNPSKQVFNDVYMTIDQIDQLSEQYIQQHIDSANLEIIFNQQDIDIIKDKPKPGSYPIEILIIDQNKKQRFDYITIFINESNELKPGSYMTEITSQNISMELLMTLISSNGVVSLEQQIGIDSMDVTLTSNQLRMMIENNTLNQELLLKSQAFAFDVQTNQQHEVKIDTSMIKTQQIGSYQIPIQYQDLEASFTLNVRPNHSFDRIQQQLNDQIYLDMHQTPINTWVSIYSIAIFIVLFLLIPIILWMILTHKINQISKRAGDIY